MNPPLATSAAAISSRGDDDLPTGADVARAAERIGSAVHRTRLVHSAAASALAGVDVWLKREDEQAAGTYRVRGTTNAVAMIEPALREKGVVTASAGSHAVAVAHAATRLGLPVTLFLPRATPDAVKVRLRTLGAVVDASQRDEMAAHALARLFARERRARFLDPDCSGDLLAGDAALALEIVAQLPETAMIVMPVDSEALVRTMAAALAVQAQPGTRVIRADQVDAHADDAGVAWLAREEGVAASVAGARAVAALLRGRVAGLDGLDGPIVLVIGEAVPGTAWLAAPSPHDAPPGTP